MWQSENAAPDAWVDVTSCISSQAGRCTEHRGGALKGQPFMYLQLTDKNHPDDAQCENEQREQGTAVVSWLVLLNGSVAVFFLKPTEVLTRRVMRRVRTRVCRTRIMRPGLRADWNPSAARSAAMLLTSLLSRHTRYCPRPLPPSSVRPRTTINHSLLTMQQLHGHTAGCGLRRDRCNWERQHAQENVGKNNVSERLRARLTIVSTLTSTQMSTRLTQ